jgi:hypothetical protein
MMRPKLVIKPRPPETTRLLLTDWDGEVLRAALPRFPSHPRAAPILLEGLALWIGRPLSVVLCAADMDFSSVPGLCEDFGVGATTLHYEVDVVDPARRPRGLGSFRDLRQLLLRGTL